jgi:phosphoribosylformylglycinamidine cyclo-ligase
VTVTRESVDGERGGAAPRRDAYAASGVDVGAGERAVDLMRAAVESTYGPHVLGGIGGFGAAVAVPPGMRAPVLVSSTDGVGTKTAIAGALRRWDTIGRDLVAMCADDVVCSGAAPLFFLDYIAVGRLDPAGVVELVSGIADGCRDAGCALVGGETAEHPGLLPADGFDLAGCCVGIVERDEMLDGTAARAGDVVVGLASSGLHANGYSLVRSVLERWEIELDRPYQEQLKRSLGDGETDEILEAEPAHALATVGDVLLTPTTIYTPAILALRRSLLAAGGDLHGVAHITGGGLPGNAPRMLPDGLAVRLDPRRWPVPSVIRLVAALGGVDEIEARATWNGGLGMLVAVPAGLVSLTLGSLAGAGIAAWVVGEVVPAAAVNGRRYVEAPLEGPT